MNLIGIPRSLVVLSIVCSLVCGQITQDERDAILNYHNEKRALVASGGEMGAASALPQASNMIKMVWDPALEQVAQAWADTCPPLSAAHNSNRGVQYVAAGGASASVGENVAYGAEALQAATNLYERELPLYNYGIYIFGGPGLVTGHTTQVIWSTSTHLGCGLQRACSPWSPVVVCNYWTAGNRGNQFPYEEGAPCSNCPEGYCCDSTGFLCTNEGCSEATPGPTASPTAAPTPGPTASPTDSPTASASPTGAPTQEAECCCRFPFDGIVRCQIAVGLCAASLGECVGDTTPAPTAAETQAPTEAPTGAPTAPEPQLRPCSEIAATMAQLPLSGDIGVQALSLLLANWGPCAL